MAEWFKAPVLKTGVPQGTGGSNLSPSANFIFRLPKYHFGGYFFLHY